MSQTQKVEEFLTMIQKRMTETYGKIQNALMASHVAFAVAYTGFLSSSSLADG
jgi:hypothetical protein